MNMTKVPPIIDSAKLLCFATNDDDVKFTDRISLFIGGNGGDLEPIGEVTNLAIVETCYEPQEILLLFCDENWLSKGAIPFTSIDEAKLKAERGYEGISEKWIDSPYTEEEINNYLRDVYEVDPHSEWWKMICSFCGKDCREVEGMVSSERATICYQCIEELYQSVNKGNP